MKNYIPLLCLVLFAFNIFSQRSIELTLIGDYVKLDRTYSENSISIYDDNKLLANFSRFSPFARWSTEEKLSGKGYCILFQNKILHFSLDADEARGTLYLGIYNYNSGSEKYELLSTNNSNFRRSTKPSRKSSRKGDYIVVVENRLLSYSDTPVSIEFLNSSILFLVDAGDYFLLRTIPDIESEQLEILNFDMKIMKE